MGPIADRMFQGIDDEVAFDVRYGSADESAGVLTGASPVIIHTPEEDCIGIYGFASCHENGAVHGVF